MNDSLSAIEPGVPEHDRRRVRQARRGERLVAQLSARFINLPAGEIDDAMAQALRQIVETFRVDRCTLTEFSADLGNMRFVHSWAVDGVEPVSTWLSTSEVAPWAIARCKGGLPVVFDRIDDLPPEANVDKVFWRQIGLKSHIILPLFSGGALGGALSLGCARHERAWSRDELADAHRLAEVFANALARKCAQEDVERALGFERLLANISASLLREPPRNLESSLREALRAIGEFLHADLVALWGLDARVESFNLMHGWVADAAGLPLMSTAKGGFPWMVQRISCDVVVNCSNVDELPPQAEVDQRSLRQLGVRALLVVPVAVEGVVFGGFSLASVRVARTWPEGLVPRVRLLGEMFAALLVRQRAADGVRQAQIEAAQHRERLAHLVRVHTVGEMSASIAHEINQPLVAIENYAQAARRRLGSGDVIDTKKLDELLDKIAVQAARAGDVLQRLRTMLRKHDPETAPTDLGRLVSETLKLVELEGTPEDLRIEMVIAPGLPPVVADAIQIQQVVLNLVRNAFEAMDGAGARGGSLKLEVQADGEHHLLVRVVDRGPGVALGDQERIFEPFYSTKGSGLGVGLAICRAIVVAHGGRLWCTSNPDGGAAFEFTLPVGGAGD